MMNLSILFLVLLAGSTGISLVFAGVALRHRATPGALSFALVIVGEAIWSVGYFFEILAPTLSGKIILDNLQFAGVDAIAAGSLLFALAYTGRNRLASRLVPLLWIVPILNLLMVWTNPIHHLVSSSPVLINTQGIVLLSYTYGVWMWLNILYSYALVLASIIILLRFAIRTHRIYQIQTLMVILGLSTGLIGSVATVFGLVPIPELSHLDTTPIVFAVVNPLWAWGLFRHRLLDLVPIARDVLVDHIPDGVLVVDMQRRIVDANAGAQTLSQKPAAALIGQSFDTVLPPFANVLSLREDFISFEGSLCGESFAARSSPWVEVSVNRVHRRRGQMIGWLVLVRDRSDRKRIEEDLRINQARLQTIFESAGVGIAVGNSEGRYTSFNRRAVETIGYTYDELMSMNILDLAHPDDRGGVRADMHQLLIGVIDDYQRERRYRCKDGQIIWVENTTTAVRDKQGNLESIIAILKDVTERKMMEDALRKSEERLRHILDFSPQGVVVLNEHGDIQYANPMAHQLLHEDHLVGNPFGLPVISQAHGDSGFEVDIVVQGEARSVLEIRAMETDWDSKPSYILSMNDITERKHIEDELRRAREAAEGASRTKSVFLANMSHELRTPLNAILGFAQIMARSNDQPAEHREYMAIIVRSGEHLLSLINDVLDMSKIEAGRITLHESDFSVWSLLHELEELFRLRAAEKGLSLSIGCATDVPQRIRTDAQKLRQVLINLLSNAIKFTSKGGVTMQVSGRTGDRRQGTGDRGQRTGGGERISTEQQPATEAMLHFEVSDTGSGISSQDHEHIFEPFVQTRSGRLPQEGTGLGLAISRRFVQMMGGDMWVESEVGRGSVFRFDILVQVVETVAMPPEQRERRSVIGLAPGQPVYRILVVDDQPDNRRMLVDMLMQRGFIVQEASNGQEAIAMWETWDPQLIWMDMRMPLMDGYEATRYIKSIASGQETVIIALTAGTFDEDREAALAAGCNGFVGKPFQECDIFETMKTHLDIRYVYAEEEAAQETTLLQNTLSPQSLLTLESLSVAEIAALNRAAILGDIDLLNQLATAMAPPLGAELQQLIDLFRYEQIIEATETLIKRQ
jgi:PAS domain S-box-containing protein